MTEYLKIVGGTLYDPANGVDGDPCDVWMSEGKVVVPPAIEPGDIVRAIDAAGLVVMPGGIDMHCHIAGPKVNLARKMIVAEKRASDPAERTELLRSGTMGSVPSTFVTGYRYAGLGYTTAFDAAVPPMGARQAHMQFADTPCLDKGCFVLMGNNHYIMQAIAKREPERLKAFVAWLLTASAGYAPKLVNPGGVEAWKQQPSGNVSGLDSVVEHFHVTPRQIIAGVAQAAAELNLPHPVHIHANNLGLPGNWTTTLETMKALEGRSGHLTHIQFHSYGGGAGDETTFNSRASELAEYVNAHPNITVDVGQVLFGATTSMTGDGPLGYYLSNVYRSRWFNHELEMEAGCGVAPIAYKRKNLVNALQWAIGLEWFLLVKNPWQIAMSTDHPNGGSFLAYPHVIRLLMDREFRREVAATLPSEVQNRSVLAHLDREYTLGEICTITRAAPARMLGLRNKGHLAPGADADVTIYTPQADPQAMFELPRFVIKSGHVVAEQGDLRTTPMGRTLRVRPDFDRTIERDIAAWFERYYSVRFNNYGISDEELSGYAV